MDQDWMVILGQGPKMLRYNLGSLTEHTVYEAEAVGVLLVLNMLRYEWDARREIIWLDNKVVLEALSICKLKPAQTIIDEIILQGESIWRRVQDPAFRLYIAWVKG